MGRGGSIRFVLGGDYKWGNEVKRLTVVSPFLFGPLRVVTQRTHLGEHLTPFDGCAIFYTLIIFRIEYSACNGSVPDTAGVHSA
jgi:hypothetical protein